MNCAMRQLMFNTYEQIPPYGVICLEAWADKARRPISSSCRSGNGDEQEGLAGKGYWVEAFCYFPGGHRWG